MKVPPKNWRPMTDIEREACLAMGRCRYPVASPPKRFARNLLGQAQAQSPTITDKQAENVWMMVARFRRQLPQNIVNHARTLHAGKILRVPTVGGPVGVAVPGPGVGGTGGGG